MVVCVWGGRGVSFSIEILDTEKESKESLDNEGKK